jgi:hypothetical protein
MKTHRVRESTDHLVDPPCPATAGTEPAPCLSNFHAPRSTTPSDALSPRQTLTLTCRAIPRALERALLETGPTAIESTTRVALVTPANLRGPIHKARSSSPRSSRTCTRSLRSIPDWPVAHLACVMKTDWRCLLLYDEARGANYQLQCGGHDSCSWMVSSRRAEPGAMREATFNADGWI